LIAGKYRRSQAASWKLTDDISIIVVENQVVVGERAMPNFEDVLSQGNRRHR
jgi:hypothetical protein